MVPNHAQIVALVNKKLMKDQSIHFDGLDRTEVQVLSSLQSKLFSPPLIASPRSTDCTVYVGHRGMSKANWMRASWRRSRRTCKVLGGSISIPKQGWKGIQNDLLWVFRCPVGQSLAENYLDSSWFTVRMDYEALYRIMNMLDATGKLAWGRLRLLDPNLTSRIEMVSNIKSQVHPTITDDWKWRHAVKRWRTSPNDYQRPYVKRQIIRFDDYLRKIWLTHQTC